ncbi:putative alpha-L-arabinofuranosidase C [Zalerion maritima]|uniref:non-reducing end alpha-L-arabinofuranosidase n=1 Tax=Zalerion maritima TaxID=339359 RepID=A0AAD5WPS3_9PEZI|nr:putative alpha-L-arabinofuranosidase C [Zalerion maritima]
MTTFTCVADTEVPLVEVDATKKLSKIDDMIYGGFTEHMGRCVYGGMYDPGNPLSDEHGFRKDVMDALRELDIPVVRYPGGNFVATYNWEDGVGPKELRPKRPELAWLGTESNEFGTDEFMKWLDVLSEGKAKRVEPYFALNFGTGTLREALAWVEYCNGTKDTYYANLRRKNGHPEPYNVKYWALGNEMWGPWQVGQMTKEVYAETAAQWGKAIRLLDPNVCLILCGETGHASWDHHVLRECIEFVDMHSIHIYTAAHAHMPNVTAPLSAERAIQTAAALIDMARIEKNIDPAKPQTTICFDEWNVWDPDRAPGDKGGEEAYTLSDALAVAVWLNVFIRQSRHLGMANIAQTVNVISPLMTTKEGIIKQTTWWPLLLYSKYMRGTAVACHVKCGSYKGETQPKWLQNVLQDGAPWLDVSATLSHDGMVNLAVVNISETEEFSTELRGVGSECKVYTVTGPEVMSCNMDGKEAVNLEESEWKVNDKVAFPKASLTMLRWKA